MMFRRAVLVSLLASAAVSVSQLACGPSAEPTSDGSSAALESTRPLTPADRAKAIENENTAWVQTTTCELTVDTSGPDVVITLTSDGDSGTLRVSPSAKVTFTGDDRYSDYQIDGIGTIEVIYALDDYVEMDLTPAATQKRVTCGMYWG
jgi:hypothetical protein